MKYILVSVVLVFPAICFAQLPINSSWEVPQDWEYILGVGSPEIYNLYTSTVDGNLLMDVYSHRTAGILGKDVPIPLAESTAIEWSWKVDQLPSPVSENSAASHDYISLAVLFDNGQDISYVWSRDLPLGHGFRCPLPEWANRETHVVVRYGEVGLNTWLTEKRYVFEDYRKYVGDDLPQNISQVWLITNSLFQGGTAKAIYRDISISTSESSIPNNVL